MKLSKRNARFLLVALGLSFLVFMVFPVWLSKGSRDAQEQTYDSIVKVRLACVDGTKQEVHPWNNTGYSVSCRKGDVLNGPWQGWQNGMLLAKGTFQNNEQHLDWSFFHPDGRLYKVVTFDQGREVETVEYKKE